MCSSFTLDLLHPGWLAPCCLHGDHIAMIHGRVLSCAQVPFLTAHFIVTVLASRLVGYGCLACVPVHSSLVPSQTPSQPPHPWGLLLPQPACRSPYLGPTDILGISFPSSWEISSPALVWNPLLPRSASWAFFVYSLVFLECIPL